MRTARWLLVAGVALSVLLSLVLGYAVQTFSDTQYLASTRSGFIVTETETERQDGRDDAAWDAMRTVASDHRVNFYRVLSDPTSPEVMRRVTAIVGDPTLHRRVFPGGSYAGFAASVMTELDPPTGNARGAFLATLPGASMSSVLRELADHGISAQADTVGWGPLLEYMAWKSPVPATAMIGAISVMMLGLLHGRRRSRALALDRTRGRRWPVLRQLMAVVAVAAGGSAAGFVVARVVLGSLNGGNQFREFALVSTTLCLVMTTAFAVGFLLATPLTRARRYLAAHSGWRPHGNAAPVMGVASAVVLVVTAVLVAQGSSALVTLVQADRSRGEVERCTPCTTTVFGPTTRDSDFDRAEHPYAAAVRSAEDAGKVIVAMKVGATRGSVFAPDHPASNVIVANRQFLHAVGLPDPLSKQPRSGDWAVVLPTSERDATAETVGAWRDWLAFQRMIEPTITAARDPSVGYYGDRTVYNFGALEQRDRLYSDSPVIVVLPAGSDLFAEASYLSAGSSGEVIFAGSQAETRRLLTRAGVDADIVATSSYANQISRARAAAEVRVSGALLGSVLGFLLVCLLSSVRTHEHRSFHRARLLQGRALGVPPPRLHRGHMVGGLSIGVGAAVLLGGAHVFGFTGQYVELEMLGFCSGVVFVVFFAADLVGLLRRDRSGGSTHDVQ